MANLEMDFRCFWGLLVILCLIDPLVSGIELQKTPGENCQSVCSTTFQGPDQSFCFRGCRLMSVIDFIQGPISTLDEVAKSCFQACSEAYGSVNSTACAFGCQSELPNIEEKRNQFVSMRLGLGDQNMMNMMDSFVEHSQRMMNCFLEQINHQMRYGWIIVSSSVSSSEGGRVVIIRGTPVRIAVHTDTSSEESKTSDYYESNLAVVDSGATPDVKQSQMMSLDFVAPYQGKDDSPSKSVNTRVHERYDWLSCLSAKTGLSKMSILFVLLTFLIILIWFIVGIVFPTRSSEKSTDYPKLSIYGDLEYLTPMDKKSLAFPPAQKFVTYTAPHLAKMQQI